MTALARAGTPVNGTALSYVRQAIYGEIEAIVPCASLIGAHHILTSVYGFSNDDASALMTRFMDAKHVHWHEEMPEGTVRAGFDCAGTMNIDAWDGYYAQVTAEEGAETILTIDDDFESLADISAEVILSADEFATLNDYLGY